MTEDEAKQLKPGDQITVLATGKTLTVSHVTDEPFHHTHIWLQETGRYLIPGQAGLTSPASS